MIYSRQKGEPLKAYAAFNDYLEDRDFVNIAVKNDKSLDEVKRWSEKYSWDERAELYDFEKSLQEYASTTQSYKSTLELHINLGKMLQAKGAKIIQDAKSIDDKTGLAIKMIATGVEIERSAWKAKKNLIRV